jgi:hypothetical protein
VYIYGIFLKFKIQSIIKNVKGGGIGAITKHYFKEFSAFEKLIYTESSKAIN